MSSPDALAALLEELRTLRHGDRRAIEALLSSRERAQLTCATRVFRTHAVQPAPLDLSPYSGALAKLLLPIMVEGAHPAARPTPAAQAAIRTYLSRSAGS